MWWLCIRFPSLMLDSIGLRESPVPSAIIERQIILQANPAAINKGIKPGQSMATALSLYPELNAIQRQAQKEQQLLQQAALWTYRFSPMVSIDQDSAALYTELRGSLRLFKGFNRLYRYYSLAYEKRHIQFCCGLAYSPSASYIVSYGINPPGFYRRTASTLDYTKIHQQIRLLPVTLLPCAKETIRTLQSSGIKQLGALFDLPEAALGKRFGQGFCQLVDYLKGTKSELRTPYMPPETFYSNRHFNGGLDNKQQLHKPITELLAELKYYLRLRQRINRNLHWQLHYIDGKEEPLFIHTSHGFFQQQSLFELTLLKLEQFTLHANVEAISLQCKNFETIKAQNNSLFEQDNEHSFFSQFDNDAEAFSDIKKTFSGNKKAISNNANATTNSTEENYTLLLDKLLNRLDYKHCYKLSENNHLLPEKAWRGIGFNEASAGKIPEVIKTPPRPLWLFPQLKAISKKQKKLYWQGYLELLQGPERIDNEWWQHRQARDYYIARHESGVIYWIFNDQLKHLWFIHGVFA